MEKEFSKEQEWLRELQSRPAANTNKNSIPVNPITLQYLQTPEVRGGHWVGLERVVDAGVGSFNKPGVRHAWMHTSTTLRTP